MSGVTNPNTADEDKKPNDPSAAHINLKVKGQDGNEVFFRIKRGTQLKKLMNAYCDRSSVEFNSIAFLFDGRRLRPDQTPDDTLRSAPDERPRLEAHLADHLQPDSPSPTATLFNLTSLALLSIFNLTPRCSLSSLRSRRFIPSNLLLRFRPISWSSPIIPRCRDESHENIQVKGRGRLDASGRGHAYKIFCNLYSVWVERWKLGGAVSITGRERYYSRE
ncbi:hypothetical protein Droror1_Dr00014255 [Drosera rotundifolia]